MERFSRLITKNHVAVLIISAVIFLLAVFGMMLTKINYDILSYLPTSLNSVQGEKILDKSFKSAGSALLLTDITDIRKAQAIKDKIEKVDGVEKVLWIDSSSDTRIPLDMISDSLKKQFIKGDTTLMNIQFNETASSDRTYKAVEQIRGIMDSQSKLGGMAALLTDLRNLMDDEKIAYIITAVVLIMIIIGIALDSFAIPVIFLVSIGMAIAFNMGTNFVQGRISYITSSLAAVLQLGVTMDFSIFLYHRYEQERKKFPDKYQAMQKAMCSTSVAIIASSLATASGFLALIPMQLGIGKDMGIVLAKGVIIGVITALTVLPALLLTFDKLINKTRHRPVLPTFKGTAEFVTKRYKIIFIIFLILFIPAIYGKSNTKIFYNIMDAMPSDMQSMKDTDAVKEKFNISEVIYLITEKSQPREKEEAFVSDLKTIPNVKDSQSTESFADSVIPDNFLPQQLKDQFERDKYRMAMINLTTKAGEDSTDSTLDTIQKTAEKYFGKDYYLCGEAVLMKDLIKLTDQDIKTVDIISILAILVILLFAYKSVSMPLILVGIIELAIFINLGLPYYTNTTLPFIASMTIGAIQLGSTVNYSILMVSRYREELQFHDKFQAMKNAVIGTGPSIITSALTLAVATIAVGLIAKVKMIGQFATMIGRGTLISFVCIILALPATLLVTDFIVKRTTIGWNKSSKAGKVSNSSTNSIDMDI